MSKLESAALLPRAHLSPRRCACGGLVGSEGECAACRQKRLQGSSSDVLEREATRIAGRVTNGSELGTDTVPRLTTTAHLPPAEHANVRSRGQELDRPTRRTFEGRLGHDFGSVRVHTDARAAASARELGALAYMVGPNIVFGEGEYAPSTPAGRRLLAHELVHVVQQRHGPAALQRQVAPTTRTGTGADSRDFVRTTIEFLNSSAQFYADPLVRVDGALFERVINSWYVMVTDRETMIDTSLGGDRALKADLHAAYQAALHVLVRRAAAALGQSEDDLYTRNTGRIPMWAWPTPHHLEPGISTPIEEGRSADILTGAVQFMTNGFSVSIDPDTPDPGLGDRAETRIDLRWVLPGYRRPEGRRGGSPASTRRPHQPCTFRRSSGRASPPPAARATDAARHQRTSPAARSLHGARAWAFTRVVTASRSSSSSRPIRCLGSQEPSG